MTASDLLHQPAAQAVGWALLHFVWQGALIGVLTSITLVLLRRSAADVRYVVSTIALTLMATMPVVTGVQVWQDEPAAVARTAVAAPTGAPVALTAPVASAPVRSPRFDGDALTRAGRAPRGLSQADLEPWLPFFLTVWLSGVFALTLRLASGWVWVQRMKSHGTAPATAALQAIAVRLARRLHISRPVRLLESALVDVPTVIGWMKPVVLLPASALAGLTPTQLEAILAHELAHVRRHDYLVNLLQTLVETLLFYHPAVWWLSRRIRAERENCCDDLAVSLCGDPYTYAKALADLEDLRGAGGRLVMAATGGSLLQRVRRLLGAPTHAGRAPGWLAGSASVMVLLGIVAAALGTSALTAQVPKLAGTPAPNQSVTPQLAAVGPRSSVEGAAAVAAARPVSTEKADVEAVEGANRAVEQAGAAVASTSAQIAIASAVVTQAATAGASSQDVPAIVKSGRTSGNFVWSHNGDKLEINYNGDVEFTDDDTDVKRLSPGGVMRIKEGGWFGGRTVEFQADASGNLTRRYWAGMSEKPFDPEGRQWLAQVLPRFIRQTGIGAASRVARILKAQGPAGVLREISLIEGSWGKRLYFTELLKTPLDPAATKQVLAQAGREIDSDFELASLLIDSADKLLVDDGTRQAYFEAARTIESDFEMRRVFSSALKRGPVGGPLLANLLETSHSIDSDFEEASLLVQIAALQPLDKTTRDPFFAALDTVSSSFEHRRVLSALGKRSDLGVDTTAAMLKSAASIDSDSEAASFLVQLAQDQPIEGTLRAPFFKAADSIGSAFERGRVLKAVVHRPDVSAETVLSVLRSAQGMKSNFEVSQLLLAVVAVRPLSGEARDLYVDIASGLGDFEQGRALAALVKAERKGVSR